ncbi:hypothetical protein MNBD_GAMMA16-103, partial [hydrothermal vent metagenome]
MCLHILGQDALKNNFASPSMLQQKPLTSTFISAGCSFRGKIEEQVGTDIHAIQMKDVSEERGLNRDTVVETSLPSKRPPDWLQADDILFIARGSRIFATLYDGTFKTAVASPHFFVIR